MLYLFLGGNLHAEPNISTTELQTKNQAFIPSWYYEDESPEQSLCAVSAVQRVGDVPVETLRHIAIGKARASLSHEIEREVTTDQKKHTVKSEITLNGSVPRRFAVTKELVVVEVCLEPATVSTWFEMQETVSTAFPPHVMTWKEILDNAKSMQENRASYTFLSLASHFGAEAKELSSESQQERLHTFASIRNSGEKYTMAAFQTLQDQSLPINELNSCVLSAIYAFSSYIESEVLWEQALFMGDIKRTFSDWSLSTAFWDFSPSMTISSQMKGSFERLESGDYRNQIQSYSIHHVLGNQGDVKESTGVFDTRTKLQYHHQNNTDARTFAVLMGYLNNRNWHLSKLEIGSDHLFCSLDFDPKKLTHQARTFPTSDMEITELLERYDAEETTQEWNKESVHNLLKQTKAFVALQKEEQSLQDQVRILGKIERLYIWTQGVERNNALDQYDSLGPSQSQTEDFKLIKSLDKEIEALLSYKKAFLKYRPDDFTTFTSEVRSLLEQNLDSDPARTEKRTRLLQEFNSFSQWSEHLFFPEKVSMSADDREHVKALDGDYYNISPIFYPWAFSKPLRQQQASAWSTTQDLLTHLYKEATLISSSEPIREQIEQYHATLDMFRTVLPEQFCHTANDICFSNVKEYLTRMTEMSEMQKKRLIQQAEEADRELDCYGEDSWAYSHCSSSGMTKIQQCEQSFGASLSRELLQENIAEVDTQELLRLGFAKNVHTCISVPKEPAETLNQRLEEMAHERLLEKAKSLQYPYLISSMKRVPETCEQQDGDCVIRIEGFFSK